MTTRSGPSRTPAPTPTVGERLAMLLRFSLGVLVVSFRYLWRVTAMHRSESAGDASDLPPPLPAEQVDDEIKTLVDGVGPFYHRRFGVTIRDARHDARGLMDALVTDLDRAAPSEVVTFRKLAGEMGRLEEGDAYRVRMPGPWDGPVRVVHRDATSFRFATLASHLEAGQIEFRARDEADGRLVFEIEAWSRAGDGLANLVYSGLKIGKEVQLNMWVQFCLSTSSLARGRREGGIRIDTRRVEHPEPTDRPA